MRRAIAILLGTAALAGCNQYDMFRLAGYQQESFSNKADILFVIDNSDSMTDEASALATNFEQFIGRIQTQEEQIVREDLGDAVANYKDYVQDRGSFVDFQIGITTTEVDNGWGELKGAGVQKLLDRGDDALAGKFIENLLCDATCFRDNIPSDPDYVCGQPLGDEVTEQYLDCVCGAGTWQGTNCATSGREEGLEAVFMAICRSVPNPPEECFEATSSSYNPDSGDYEALFTDADVLSSEGLMRENSTFIPVIVTDEGDDSRRENSGDQFPDRYKALFEKFNTRMSWVVIAPPLDGNFESPPGCFGYTDWGVFRYDFMVRISDGLKIPISAPAGGDCPNTDFGDNLDQFGALLQNLLTVFELQSIPDPETLLVFVDRKEIPRAEVINTDAFGLPIYGAGWSYEAEVNAIRFHGDAVPPNDATVQVYYEPLDGMPRELPL